MQCPWERLASACAFCSLEPGISSPADDSQRQAPEHECVRASDISTNHTTRVRAPIVALAWPQHTCWPALRERDKEGNITGRSSHAVTACTRWDGPIVSLQRTLVHYATEIEDCRLLLPGAELLLTPPRRLSQTGCRGETCSTPQRVPRCLRDVRACASRNTSAPARPAHASSTSEGNFLDSGFVETALPGSGTRPISAARTTILRIDFGFKSEISKDHCPSQLARHSTIFIYIGRELC